MKNIRNIFFLFPILFLASGIAIIAQVEHIANVKKSTVEWVGYKKTGEHNGTVQILNGNLNVQNDIIVGGYFEIDMKSIQVFDNDSEKLLEHLKSEDFFDAKEFPKVIFKITGIKYGDKKSLITGMLTIKETTNKIVFNADIGKNESGKYVIKSEKIELSREKFNIRYKSTSFISNLKNSFIKDNFEIYVNVITE